MLAQLEAAPLLRRLDLASDKQLRVRGAQAPRADAASAAGSTRRGDLGFAHLPLAVALHIFSYVPLFARARAALVCRAWRDTVADARLWTVLDLSPASGVAQPVSDATLSGAAALARGQLTVLRLDDCRGLTDEARLEVVQANAECLRELSCQFEYDHEDLTSVHVEHLVAVAPQLVTFKVDVSTESMVAVFPMLKNEAPFGALQLRRLFLAEDRTTPPPGDVEVLEFCSAVSTHVSLNQLVLCDVPLGTPAAINALSAALLACKLRELRLNACLLSPASVPALERLIRGGVLESLIVVNENEGPLLHGAAAVQLADALAVSRTLTRLGLSSTYFWHDADAAAAIMRALTGHPRIQQLDLSFNAPEDDVQAGVALGALIAANTAALTSLSVWSSDLGDAGLGPLFDALPRNSHLRELNCAVTGMSAAFARDVFLPAVRANTLRKLDASANSYDDEGNEVEALPELLEAEVLVAARNIER